MTQTEINRYKGLIAEFLGFEIAERTTWHFFGPKTEYHYLLPQPYGSDDNFDSTKQYYSIEDLNKSLRFDTSWDWILAAYSAMTKNKIGLKSSHGERMKGNFLLDYKVGAFQNLIELYEELRESGAVKSMLEKKKKERHEFRAKK